MKTMTTVILTLGLSSPALAAPPTSTSTTTVITTCESSGDSALSVFESILVIPDSLLQSLPPSVINEPHPHAILCANPPLVTLHETLHLADVTARIPLSSFSTAPMTQEAFVAAIKDVRLPNPWGLGGSVKWKIEGTGNAAALVVSLENATTDAASAWRQVPAPVLVLLASGQLVNIEVSSATMTVDDTAKTLKSIRDQQAFLESQIRSANERLAVARREIADPSTLFVGNDEFLTGERARLANWEATVAKMRPELQARYDAADIDALVAHVALENRVTGADHDPYVALRKAEFDANNAAARAVPHVKDEQANVRQLEEVVVKFPGNASLAAALENERAVLRDAEANVVATKVAKAAARAALDRFIAAHDLNDALLGAYDVVYPVGDARFTNMLLGSVSLRTRIAADAKQVAEERLRRVGDAKVRVAEEEKAIRDRTSELAALTTRLASAPTERRSIPTTHDVVCPTR